MIAPGRDLETPLQRLCKITSLLVLSTRLALAYIPGVFAPRGRENTRNDYGSGSGRRRFGHQRCPIKLAQLGAYRAPVLLGLIAGTNERAPRMARAALAAGAG